MDCLDRTYGVDWAAMKMQGDSAAATAETNKYLGLGRWKQ
jgi:hypothetical protein